MIKVMEIREQNDVSSLTLAAKELSTTDALKILLTRELGQGAIIAKVSETSLTTLSLNPDGSWNQVDFEGTSEELKPLLEQVVPFSVAWNNNNQLLENLCNGEIETPKPTDPPRACAFAAPVFLTDPDNTSILLGRGLRSPKKSTMSGYAMATLIEKIKAKKIKVFVPVFRPHAPLTNC